MGPGAGGSLPLGQADQSLSLRVRPGGSGSGPTVPRCLPGPESGPLGQARAQRRPPGQQPGGLTTDGLTTMGAREPANLNDRHGDRP